MRRRSLLAALALSPFATAPATAATLSTPLSYDMKGRPLADVLLNGAGPFALCIDTAAGGTVLSAQTIAALGLSPTGRVRVNGSSGTARANRYNLAHVAIAGLARENVLAVEMPADSASAAHLEGVLGIGVFAGARIIFDFAANQLIIDTGEARAPLANAVALRFRHRLFALASVSVGGVSATALIDTGAWRTTANAALREALGFTENDARLREVEPTGGATAHQTPTVAAEVTPLHFAGHDFGALDLAFADLRVFRTMGLANRPALVLGIDAFRRVRALTLDYTSGELALEV